MEIIGGNLLALARSGSTTIARGEYVFPVSFGRTWRARNWIEAHVGTSCAKSTPHSAQQNQLNFLLDEHRSINAVVETFFKTIKAELVWRRTWETRRQAETTIFQYINGFYNPRRRHSALGGKSPLAFERQAA